MLRSLFSAVSGMKNNQIKMDVISNNIANVNTTAFKAGRVRFQDIFSQTLQGATAPSTGGRGGINPRQIGLGMQVGGIDTITNQGAPQPTGRPLDAAIQGEGYFILTRDGSNSNLVYTRDGSFSLDSDFNIISSDGYKLMGYAADPATNTTTAAETAGTLTALRIPDPKEDASGNPMPNKKIVSFSIEVDGTVKAVYEGDTTPTVLGRISLAKFANPAGLLKTGNNNYLSSENSGTADDLPASSGGTGDIMQATLEMSNVDLASEFTDMIITSRAFQANSRSITTSDEMLQELLNLKR